MEEQLKRKTLLHNWEEDRECDRLLELMSLSERKIVSEMQPDEKLWLESEIAAKNIVHNHTQL